MRVIAFFVLVTSCVLALEPPMFVSLGSACETASRVEDFGLKCATYPFDWLLSVGPQTIAQILKEDFAFFLEESYFIPHPYHADVVVNQRYQIEMRHDWKGINLWENFSRYRETFPEIREKYVRRIARFRRLGEYQGKVFFIRAAIDFDVEERIASWATPHQRIISSQESSELKHCLRNLFPSLDFTLVVINYLEELPNPIEVEEGIIEFKFRRSCEKRDAYGSIFKSLSAQFSG